MELLKSLCAVHAPSGEEYRMKEFLLEYIYEHEESWKKKPVIVSGNELQDAIILVFGTPKTAIYAHMDSTGYMVRYNNGLVPIGGPDTDNTLLLKNPQLTAKYPVKNTEPDGTGDWIIESRQELSPGTTFTFAAPTLDEGDYIVSPYLDDRLGVWACLELAKTLENGAIVFTAYEEHGGGSAETCARYLYEKFKITQAVIADITWATEGVKPGLGVAVSIRDKFIPRRGFVDRVCDILKRKDVQFQIEVESSGSSDGGYIQRCPYPIDWCFVGPPETGNHSPRESVHKSDIEQMLKAYKTLMTHL